MVIEKKDTGIVEIMERDRHRQLNEHSKEVNKHKKEAEQGSKIIKKRSNSLVQMAHKITG